MAREVLLQDPDYIPLFFPIYDPRLRLTDIAIYSITPPKHSEYIAKLLASYFNNPGIITDATGCIGGNTYYFEQYFRHVNFVEIDPLNAKIFNWNNKLIPHSATCTIYQTDYLKIANKLKQDVIFLDTPWGGPDYIKRNKMELYLSGVPLRRLIPQLKAKLIAVKVPRNYDFYGGHIYPIENGLYYIVVYTDLQPPNNPPEPVSEGRIRYRGRLQDLVY